MDYQITAVDIQDAAALSRVDRLLSDNLGVEVASDKLAKNTTTNSGSKSLYLAAFQGDEIIGFNAFISHDLIYDASTINCYQSCWTATSNKHRGKKVFQNLINTAKEILLSRGAGFIFGFGNVNSQPILKNKLGFREIPSLKWQVPNLSLIRDFYLAKPKPNRVSFESNAILQNDRQLIELKTREYQDELIVVEWNESLIWGVGRKNKKYGIDLRYFEIGGICIKEPGDIHLLFRRLLKTVKRSHYIQLTVSATNPYVEILNNLKPARTNDLTVFDLCFETAGVNLNFFGGVKDVF